jgi:hypothetical protein
LLIMKLLVARLHTGVAWLLFLGCWVALYLIALSVFGGGEATTHGAFGRTLFLVSLAMLVASLVVRSSRLNVGLSVLVPVLLFMQGMFVYLPPLPPAVRALHALNGLAIMIISYSLANGRARAVVESKQPAVTSYQPAS